VSKNPFQSILKRVSRIHWPTVLLILGIVIILIPTAIVGKTLYDAFNATGVPMFGSRFDADLNPKISNTQLTQIEQMINSENQVESVSVNLKTATLRITVDMVDDITLDQVSVFVSTILNELLTILPQEQYFAMQGISKQYDLELHVINNRTFASEDNFIYVLANLNSNMEGPLIQLVSDPKNPEFVQELYDLILERQLRNQDTLPGDNLDDDEDDE